MSNIKVLIQKKSKTIIIQADQFDQNDYSLNIADDNTVEVYNTNTNQLVKKVKIPFGTSNIGRVTFARFKNNIYTRENVVDFKPLTRHGNQYVSKDYTKIKNHNVFNITNFVQFDPTESEMKQNIVYRYIVIKLANHYNLNKTRFFDSQIYAAFQNRDLAGPISIRYPDIQRRESVFDDIFTSIPNHLITIEANREGFTTTLYKAKKKFRDTRVRKTDLSLNHYCDQGTNSGVINLKHLFKTKKVRKLFPGAEYAVLHDLQHDQAYFASLTQDKEFIHQAFPIQTYKKHIIGNVKVSLGQQIGFTLPKDRHATSSHLANLHLFNKKNTYLGEIHLTK